MLKPSPISSPISSLQEEVKSQQHLQWLDQPFTRIFLKELNDKRNNLLKEVENLSVSLPRNTDMINNKLVESLTIRKLIETYANHRNQVK